MKPSRFVLLGCCLMGAGCATMPVYETPGEGRRVVIEHRYDTPTGLFREGRRDPVEICQVIIDNKKVFPADKANNIPYLSEYETRMSPGTHKIGIYWGATFMGGCTKEGLNGELEIADKDIHILLKNDSKSFLSDYAKGAFGWKESIVITEIHNDGNEQPSSDGEIINQEEDTPPCTKDIARFCSKVPRGQNRVMNCLKQHREKLSPRCRKDMAKYL